MSRAVVVVVAALLVLVPVLAQEATFRSAVRTVAVYATVQDAGGRLVPDLTERDFAVRDNDRSVAITTFSNDAQPITVAVMLDMSGSMSGRMLRVRESTRKFVAALAPVDRATIGTFGQELFVSPLLTSNHADLNRVLTEELWPGGSTPLWAAIDRGMTALERERGRRVVLVLTDGLNACSGFRGECRGFGDVRRRATEQDFMVYAIGLEGTGLSTSMSELTGETGGGHFELQQDDDLDATFARVAEELRRQYLIGFTPASLDDRNHRLQVSVGQAGMTARARRSYLARRDR
jgi:Ca-activated chloride channel family protein